MPQALYVTLCICSVGVQACCAQQWREYTPSMLCTCPPVCSPGKQPVMGDLLYEVHVCSCSSTALLQ